MYNLNIEEMIILWESYTTKLYVFTMSWWSAFWREKPKESKEIFLNDQRNISCCKKCVLIIHAKKTYQGRKSHNPSSVLWSVFCASANGTIRWKEKSNGWIQAKWIHSSGLISTVQLVFTWPWIFYSNSLG